MYIAEGEGCDLCRAAYIVTSFACPPHVVRGSMSVHICMLIWLPCTQEERECFLIRKHTITMPGQAVWVFPNCL